jgi:hypothetical protein
MKIPTALTDASPDERTEAIYNKLDKLSISSNPSLFRVSKLYLSSTQKNRIGNVRDDVVEYKLKINVGPGKYDYITLTNYVKEKNPWKTEINQNLIILPGQALTGVFYSEMAIYYAQQGYSTYILDRRETNIPVNETDFSYMENWNIDKHLSDTYDGVAVSRIHTAILSNEPVENIEITAIGHSHGALILTAYAASEYKDLSSGSVDRIVSVDIVIKYDPEHSKLIQSQAQEFEIISKSMENGTYNATGMAIMMQIANLALIDPEGRSFVNNNFANRQIFRLMASQTYTFNAHPYTPNYHYWSGDLNGLHYVDENRLLNLTLTGGAVPHTPKYMDRLMAGLMGNVDGYEIDYSRIDSPVLYIGLGGGFNDYGSWWYKNEVGRINGRVTSMNWNDQGHCSIALDYNSPGLWALINNWIKNNPRKK